MRRMLAIGLAAVLAAAALPQGFTAAEAGEKKAKMQKAPVKTSGQLRGTTAKEGRKLDCEGYTYLGQKVLGACLAK